jgi:hypothetical protein
MRQPVICSSGALNSHRPKRATSWLSSMAAQARSGVTPKRIRSSGAERRPIRIGNRGLASQKYLVAPGPRGVIHAGVGLAVLLYLVASVLL